MRVNNLDLIIMYVADMSYFDIKTKENIRLRVHIVFYLSDLILIIYKLYVKMGGSHQLKHS